MSAGIDSTSGDGRSSPRNIHIASAGYLRLFAVDGRVMVHDVMTGQTARKGVAAAGRRRDWWGSEAGLSQAVEGSLNQCENPALRTLRAIERHWPLSRDRRGVLAQFVAIHVIRTPAFGAFVRTASEEAIADEAVRSTIEPALIDGALEIFRGDRVHADSLLRQITRLASMFMSMQWVLVSFGEELLITGDQPVIALPTMPPGRQSNAEAVPSRGFLDTIEVRFPVDPRHALLMTWRGDEDTSVGGSFAQACNMNASIGRQADKEWFFKPGAVAHRLNPATLQRDVVPISTELFPEYTSAAALRSKRRLETERVAAQIIQQEPPPDRMPFVNTRRRRGSSTA